MIRFHGSVETLAAIENLVSSETKGVYLRFGDGDVNLACGMDDLMQLSEPSLAFELQDAFSLFGPTVLKTLPLYCAKYGGLESGMFPGNHECPENWCDDIVRKAQTYWGPMVDVYSHVALTHTACVDPDRAVKFLKLISAFKTVFIGNENVPERLIHRIFPHCSEIFPTPAKNAYSCIGKQYDGWKSHIQENRVFTLVVTCMGCSGRVVEKKIYKDLNNVFIFDFGSLMDSLCGWDTRAWMNLSGFKAKDFLDRL